MWLQDYCRLTAIEKRSINVEFPETYGLELVVSYGTHRVPGEIKRREVELDPQPRRDHEQGGGAELRKLDFFRFGLFLNSAATDIVLVTLPITAVETANAQCTSRCAMARGHRLNTSIVLAAVHGLSGLFRAVSAVEPSLSRPLPPLCPSLISHLASEDVKQYGQLRQWLEKDVVKPCLEFLVLGRSVGNYTSGPVWPSGKALGW